MRSEYFWRMRSASALRFSKGCSSLNLLRILMVLKMEGGCLGGVGAGAYGVLERYLRQAEEVLEMEVPGHEISAKRNGQEPRALGSSLGAG